MLIVIVALSLVALISIIGAVYYKTAIAPSKIKPVSKMPYYEASQWKPQAVQPNAQAAHTLGGHKTFEMKLDKKVMGMKKVFRAFEDRQPENPKKVEPPKPTDNIFDKFTEIPVKNGEDAFKEIKDSLREGKKRGQ
jgi:hypothetical protein